MRGGHNKKTIQDHIQNGTYRPCLHGYISISDEETLKEMKNELYTSFKIITNELKKIDLDKDMEKYKSLNEERITYIKAFHSIAKTPVEDKSKDIKYDKDGFKTL